MLPALDEELNQTILDYYDSLENNQRRIAFADLIGKVITASRRGLQGNAGRELEGLAQLTGMLREREADAERDGQPMKAVAVRYFLNELK